MGGGDLSAGGAGSLPPVLCTSRTKAVAAILASAFGFALMAFFVRLCDDFGGSISSFQKSFFRNFIALLIAIPAFRATLRASTHSPSQSLNPTKSKNRKIPLLLLRSIFGCIGIFCNFYAISHINIADAMTLNKTSPFFAVLFSWLFLREKANRRQILCLIIAFIGALFVIKPGFRAFGTFAAFCGLMGGIGAGIAYTCVHELGRLKVNGSAIVLFFSAFSCLASIPFILWLGFDPMTWAQVLILIGAGCGAAIGQFGITAAYRYAAPREIAAFDYSGIIFTALFGFVFFAQIPDAASIIGFIAITTAAFLSSRSPRHCA